MDTRKLGRSGLSVTPMGLGLAALGRLGYINLGHATDLGDQRDISATEHRAHQPADITVGSKWGYTYTADWQIEAEKHEVKEHSLSKKELGSSRVPPTSCNRPDSPRWAGDC